MGKEDVVHIYSGILLSHEKNEIMPFAATQTDLEIIILSEVSQEKDKYMMTLLTIGVFTNEGPLVAQRQSPPASTGDAGSAHRPCWNRAPAPQLRVRALQPVLRNKRSHCEEKLAHNN